MGTIAAASDVVLRRSYDQVFAYSYSAKWVARALTRATIFSGRERYLSRATERLPETGENDEVGVQPHAVDTTDAERAEAVLMLQAAGIDYVRVTDPGGVRIVQGGNTGFRVEACG